MTYNNAKDAFEELKNFEGKADFKGEEIKIEYFVLLPKDDVANYNLEAFMEKYNSSDSFEVEGDHDASYTILGINATEMKYSNDTDYFMQLLVW